MKYLLILLLLPSLVFAMPVEDVKLDSYVNDYAGVLSNGEISELNSLLNNMRKEGKAEYAIVIVDSMDGSDALTYAQTISEGKLGNEENNGLLLLVSINDREYRFHTGRGLEAELPDILLGRIAREHLVPAFQKGSYGQGIINASKAINEQINGIPYEKTEVSVGYSIIGLLIQLLIMLLPWIIISIIIFKARKKPPKKGERHSTSDLFAAAMLGSMLGRGGGGSFGGGFGGFGGGSFGGGGAGGGW